MPIMHQIQAKKKTCANHSYTRVSEVSHEEKKNIVASWDGSSVVYLVPKL